MTQTQIDPSPGRKSARPANRYQHKSMRTEIFRRLALFTGSIVLAFYVLAPIAWLVSSSVQTESEITSRPPNWIPDNPTLDNFRAIFFGRDSALSGIDPAVAGYIPSSAAHLLPAMQNSMIVGLTVVILNLLVAIPAGYAIARIRFRGRSGTMYFILTTRVVPDISLVVPFFLIIRSLGLLDTHLALIISYLAITVPFTVFIMMSYFASLPEDLDKAARVDGCSRLQSLWHVYLPIATPAIIPPVILAVLFQSYALYPHKTVYDNIAFGLKLKKVPRDEIDRRVRDAAARLELTRLLDRRPAQLSGGQRQRVALGRAIVRQPAVFLLDEPLSNLDASLRLTMRNEIKKLHQSMATTFVYVTHDQVEALSLAHRIVVMRDGKVQQIASPDEIYSRPANIFVASFLGNPPMNFIKGELTGEGGLPVFRRGGLDIGLPEQLAARAGGGRDIVLGIRPEDVSLQPFDGSRPLTGKVVLVSPMGPETYVDIQIEGVEMMFRVPKGATFENAGALTVHVDPAAVHLFDAASEQRLSAA